MHHIFDPRADFTLIEQHGAISDILNTGAKTPEPLFAGLRMNAMSIGRVAAEHTAEFVAVMWQGIGRPVVDSLAQRLEPVMEDDASEPSFTVVK